MCMSFSHNFRNITQNGQNQSCDTIALKRRHVLNRYQRFIHSVGGFIKPIYRYTNQAKKSSGSGGILILILLECISYSCSLKVSLLQAYFFRGDGSESFMSQENKSKAPVKKAEEAGSGGAKATTVECVTAGTSRISVTTKNDGSSASKPNVICRTRPRRTLFAIFRGYNNPTPDKPKDQALDQLQIKLMQQPVQPFYEKVKKLFQQRPIWSKNALRYTMGQGSENLKYFLPTIAYYFKDGPWRNLWVRFGYD